MTGLVAGVDVGGTFTDLVVFDPDRVRDAATFEHLFRQLVHRDTRCTELSCEARGDDACRFELRW